MLYRTALVLICVGASASVAAAANKSADIARVEKTLLAPVTIVGQPTSLGSIEERLAFHNVPAVSIAVIKNGKIAWSRAYGSAVAGGSAATPQTLFQAASISKPVAAAAALSLVHRGRLSLDEPVNRYLTSWKLPDSDLAAKQPVTLRHLLSHSGGTTVSGFPGYAVGAPLPTLRNVLEGSAPANTRPIIVDKLPGEAWRYSGGGTSVMQQVLQDVSRLPFAPFMRSTILQPLGMAQSGYDQPLPPSRHRLAAVAHGPNGKPIAGKWHIYPEQAAAGLWTTPTDLARFATWVMGGLTDAGASAEHKAVAAQLTEPQGKLAPTPTQRMGLGFFLGEEGKARLFSHSGSNEGFRAFLVGFPDTGQGAVIMTNGENGAPLAQEVLRAIALEYRWPERYHRFLVPAAVPPGRLDSLAGTYKWGDAPAQQVTISAEAGRLVSKLSNGRSVLLWPENDTSFVRADSGGRIRFGEDSLTIEGGPSPLIARRVKQP